MDYYSKYLKYKNKYLDLKNQLAGVRVKAVASSGKTVKLSHAGDDDVVIARLNEEIASLTKVVNNVSESPLTISTAARRIATLKAERDVHIRHKASKSHSGLLSAASSALAAMAAASGSASSEASSVAISKARAEDAAFRAVHGKRDEGAAARARMARAAASAAASASPKSAALTVAAERRAAEDRLAAERRASAAVSRARELERVLTPEQIRRREEAAVAWRVSQGLPPAEVGFAHFEMEKELDKQRRAAAATTVASSNSSASEVLSTAQRTEGY